MGLPSAILNPFKVLPHLILQQPYTKDWFPHVVLSLKLWLSFHLERTSAHPAPVRVHLTLLSPPGQQPEDVSKDWEVEWPCPILHP